jgi:hypothetical protein
LANQSSNSTPGPHTLVIRAAFVPDGERPPADFGTVSRSITFAATLDPATGEITSDSAGMNFGGDILAEWHPDEVQDSEDEVAPDNAARPEDSPG